MTNFKEALEHFNSDLEWGGHLISIDEVLDDEHIETIRLALTAMEMLESLPRYDVFTNSYGCCDSQDVCIEEEVSHKGHQGYDDCEYIKVKDLLNALKEAEAKVK